MPSLLEVGEDVLKLTLQYLDLKDLCRVSSCCRGLRKLSISECKRRDSETPSVSRSQAPSARERVVRSFKAQQYIQNYKFTLENETSLDVSAFVAPQKYEFYAQFSSQGRLLWQGFLPLRRRSHGSWIEALYLDMQHVYPLMNWSSMEDLFECYERRGVLDEVSLQMTESVLENLDLAIIALHKSLLHVKPRLIFHTSRPSEGLLIEAGRFQYRHQTQSQSISRAFHMDCAFCTNLSKSDAMERQDPTVQFLSLSCHDEGGRIVFICSSFAPSNTDLDWNCFHFLIEILNRLIISDVPLDNIGSEDCWHERRRRRRDGQRSRGQVQGHRRRRQRQHNDGKSRSRKQRYGNRRRF